MKGVVRRKYNFQNNWSKGEGERRSKWIEGGAWLTVSHLIQVLLSPFYKWENRLTEFEQLAPNHTSTRVAKATVPQVCSQVPAFVWSIWKFTYGDGITWRRKYLHNTRFQVKLPNISLTSNYVQMKTFLIQQLEGCCIKQCNWEHMWKIIKSDSWYFYSLTV